MTPELRAMLEQWLESGTETQRRHAQWRLSITDAELSDMERAEKILAENPPAPTDRRCCNG